MTSIQIVALWPQIQTALAAQGLTMSLGQFLGLMGALNPAMAGPMPAAPDPVPVVPATLTVGGDANNAPYGYTLAGWSPQDHQGISLRDPKNAKYIVYAYLVTNQIVPSTTWATVAVPILQGVCPNVPWQAGDTETLVYGDEYVHPAPNGHGMAPGTFNHDLDGRKEFFWGVF